MFQQFHAVTEGVEQGKKPVVERVFRIGVLPDPFVFQQCLKNTVCRTHGDAQLLLQFRLCGAFREFCQQFQKRDGFFDRRNFIVHI